MKKFISFAAFVLLASALTLPLPLASCSSDDDEGDALSEVPDWSDLPEVPETAAHAKAMLKGQWRIEDHISGFAEESLCEFNADGKVYHIYKIKTNAANGMWFSPYKGKYVGYVAYDEYAFYPDATPTQGRYSLGMKGRFYKELSKSSVIMDGQEYVRPETPVEYEVIPDPD